MASETSALPLIRTKLHRPQISANLVARPWLLEWLSQHRRRPLTLVSASAGYGKTTLISSWLESVESPSAWVSLDEYDDDLTGFLTYFIAAIQTIFPEAGRDTQDLLDAPTLPPLPVLARTLANELAQLTNPFVLVLDDYHVIREAAIHELLSELLRHPPRAMHLVIITRRDPPLPTTKLRARAQVTEVRSQELRFTAAETAAFLLQLGIQVDDAKAADLARKTEGWVTGLRLSVLSVRHRGAEGFVTSVPENIHYVTDYLLAETLSQLPPAIKGFLLKTSVLDRLNGSLCDMVVGLDEPECDGQAYLEWLHQQNLFIIPLDDERQWYRYHHLFQELLHDQLARRLDRDDIAALHSRASTWFAQNDLIDEALRHALAAGDIAAAAQLVEQNGRTLLNEDQWHILEKWLAQLPDDIIQQRPKLLLAQAWVLYYRFAVWAIPPLLETVDKVLDDDESTQPLWGEIDFFWGFHWYWQGQGDRSLDLLRRAIERIPVTYHGARGEAELFWSLASQMAGQENETVRTLNKWLYYENPPHPVRQLRLEGVLIFINLLSGNLVEASRIIQPFQVTATKVSDAYARAWGSYLQGQVYYCRNDLQNAADHLTQAVEKRYVLHTKAAIDSLAGLTLTYQALGQRESAEATQALLLEFAQETNIPPYITVTHSCQARLALSQGDTAQALRWLQTVDLTTDSGPMFYWLEVPRITQCRVLIAQGTEASLQQASDLLTSYRQDVEAQHNTRQLIDILLLQALAHHKRQNFDEALPVLKRAVTLAQHGCFIRPFIEIGPELVDGLNKLRSRNIAPDYIAQILNAFSDLRFTISDLRLEEKKIVNRQSKIENLVEPLTDRELEVLELLAQRFSNKEIATELVISPLTVKKHTVNIYQKLGVKNRRQAVSKAKVLGVVSDSYDL